MLHTQVVQLNLTGYVPVHFNYRESYQFSNSGYSKVDICNEKFALTQFQTLIFIGSIRSCCSLQEKIQIFWEKTQILMF